MMLFLTQVSIGQAGSAMTFNIRYDNPGDGKNQWANRKKELGQLIQYYQPAFLGVQEALHHQVEYLATELFQYKKIGVGRDDGKTKGEYAAIFYDTSQYDLIFQETFWLSENPAAVSVGWDASMERICTFGYFQLKDSEQKILVLNAHYDHIGPLARKESSALILKKIANWNKANDPVLLMGDLNCTPDQEPISILLKGLVDAASGLRTGIYGPAGTFNGFDESMIMENRIDYILVKDLQVKTYRHIDDRMKNNNCISDHLPVYIRFEY